MERTKEKIKWNTPCDLYMYCKFDARINCHDDLNLILYEMGWKYGIDGQLFESIENSESYFPATFFFPGGWVLNSPA